MGAEERINFEVIQRTLQRLIGAVYLDSMAGTIRGIGAMADG